MKNEYTAAMMQYHVAARGCAAAPVLSAAKQKIK
jgi:hypothetical protein